MSRPVPVSARGGCEIARRVRARGPPAGAAAARRSSPRVHEDSREDPASNIEPSRDPIPWGVSRANTASPSRRHRPPPPPSRVQPRATRRRPSEEPPANENAPAAAASSLPASRMNAARVTESESRYEAPAPSAEAAPAHRSPGPPGRHAAPGARPSQSGQGDPSGLPSPRASAGMGFDDAAAGRMSRSAGVQNGKFQSSNEATSTSARERAASP